MTPEDLLRTTLAWLASHPDLAVALATGLSGSAGAVRYYRRTGSLPLAQLPWRVFRRIVYALRRRFFSAGAPPSTALVDADIEAVTERLGRQSYEPAWPLSYHYRGEDLNARRYLFDPEREHPHRQLHIRGFAQSDGTTELYAHEEPSALHHPRAHLRERDMHDATDWVGKRYDTPNGLDPRGFSHEN
jgi:hypothetical protein